MRGAGGMPEMDGCFYSSRLSVSGHAMPANHETSEVKKPQTVPRPKMHVQASLARRHAVLVSKRAQIRTVASQLSQTRGATVAFVRHYRSSTRDDPTCQQEITHIWRTQQTHQNQDSPITLRSRGSVMRKTSSQWLILLKK